MGSFCEPITKWGQQLVANSLFFRKQRSFFARTGNSSAGQGICRPEGRRAKPYAFRAAQQTAMQRPRQSGDRGVFRNAGHVEPQPSSQGWARIEEPRRHRNRLPFDALPTSLTYAGALQSFLPGGVFTIGKTHNSGLFL
jgi:hypothetical protein